MPKKTVGFDTVREIALTLPGVEDGTSYGALALKVRGKLMACVPVSREAEPDSLMVRVAPEDRTELIQGDPEVYYLTDHYVDYPAVLVRLRRIRPEALRDLLSMAHIFVTRKPADSRSSGRKR